jgi:hypothetical protein
MKKNEFIKTQILLTSIVSVAIWSLLAWYNFNGGVPSHHILAREDLPEISNWWGGILLPLLTYLVLFRVQKRENLTNGKRPKFLQIPLQVWVGFLSALILGVVLSVFFTLGNTEIPEYLILSVFFISLFFPVYRAECILGFVIGMTFTFGAILPTGIGSILAIIAFLIHHLIRPLINYLYSFIKNR